MATTSYSRCQFCSLGCGYGIEMHHGEALALEYDGPLCSRGNYLLEMLNHPLRLTGSSVSGIPASAETALSAAAPQILRDKDRTTAIVLSPEASDEDMLMARSFADRFDGTCMVAVDDPAGDLRVMRMLHELGIQNTSLTSGDIARAKVIVVVGDPFEAGPVIAGPVLDAKYTHSRNMTFSVIDEAPNRTSRFAGTFIGGSVRRNLAALLSAIIRLAGNNAPSWTKHLPAALAFPDNPDIGSTATALIGHDEAIMLVDTADPVAAVLAALVNHAAGKQTQCRIITSYGNTAGIVATGAADATMEDLTAQAAERGIAALVVLGPDIRRNPAHNSLASSADLIITASPFPNRTTRLADIVLPSALFPEYAGTWGGMRLDPVLQPPGGAQGYGDILADIATTLGTGLDTLPPVTALSATLNKDKIASFLSALPELIDQSSPVAFSRNTISRYTDGAITDMMSWTKAQTREAW